MSFILSLKGIHWFLIILLTTLLSVFLIKILETNDERSYKRLHSLIQVSEAKKNKRDEKDESVFKRIYLLIEATVKEFVRKQVLKGNLSNLDLKIEQAGAQTTSLQIWTKSVIFALAGGLLGILMQNFIAILGLTALGAYYPHYQLKEKIQKRQFDLLNQLPDFLDLVAVSFPSCDNIEHTFEVVCRRLDSEVSSEFQTAVNEIKLGRRKITVYNELALRTGLAEISTLVSQINQAESFGTSLEDVLLAQSRSIRMAKKELAEKQGNKAKMMMYIPGGLMLLVSLGVIAFPFIAQFLAGMGSGGIF